VRIGIAALVALAALFSMARLRYPGKPTMESPAEDCDADLWRHVYRADRLRVIARCTSVDGRITSLDRGQDGDLQIALDPDHASVLNLVNAIHGHRELVVEVICEHTPAAGDAAAACAAFAAQVTVPKVGDRVRVTGAYVTDRETGWNEIHPATRIEILR
jgi:hypothetical protein